MLFILKIKFGCVLFDSELAGELQDFDEMPESLGYKPGSSKQHTLHPR